MCHGYLRAECNSNLLIQVLTNKMVRDTELLEAQSKHAGLITLMLSFYIVSTIIRRTCLENPVVPEAGERETKT